MRLAIRLARVANDCAPPFVVYTWVWLLALLVSACHTVPVHLPGTERDAAWDACDGGPVGWHCWGHGPIWKVCDETVLFGLIGWGRRDCHWERIDHAGGRGATVPYKETSP